MASAGPGDEPRELLAAPWYARTRVHEYGGRSYLPVPSASGPAVRSRLRELRRPAALPAGGAARTRAARSEPAPLTPDDAGFRFADLILSPDGAGDLVRAGDRRPDDGRPEAGFHAGGGMKVNRAIVAVPLDGSAADDAGAIRVLVTGADFFAFPTPSPDGTRLAWISWDHPRMPWDGTELRIGPVTGSTVGRRARWSWAARAESVLAPRWRDDETLYAICDASGWWNLYETAAAGRGRAPAAAPGEEEFAGPLWQLGGRPFELLADGRLAVLHGLGELQLAALDPATGALADLHLPGYRTGMHELAVSGTTIATWPAARPPRGRCCGSSPARATTPASRSCPSSRSPGPTPPTCRTRARRSCRAGRTDGVIHALVYPPANPHVTAPDGERPPFMVFVHGGPTSNALPVLTWRRRSSPAAASGSST